MPANELLRRLVFLVVLVPSGACDPEQEAGAPIEPKPIDRGRGPSTAHEHQDSGPPSHGATQTITDVDDSTLGSDREAAPPQARELKLASGAVLVLADPTRAQRQRQRAALEAEVGPLPEAVRQAELERLRLQWFMQGTGIVFQNTTDHLFGVTVYFSSSEDPECRETAVRTRVEAKRSTAPSPTRTDCAFDTATVTLFDELNMKVGTVTLTPGDV